MRQSDDGTGAPRPRGILRSEVAGQVFSLRFFAPDPELHPWIDYYWSISWDREEEFIQTVISNPTIDVSFENDPGTNGPGWRVIATGVWPRAYERRLRGRGFVFAAHFRPGMFRPWWGGSVASLSGKALELPDGLPWRSTLQDLLKRHAGAEPEEWTFGADSAFLSHRPPEDPVACEIRDLVEASRRDRSLWSTESLADRRSISVRSCQRQFMEYVGITPGWVARRHRIQSILEALDEARRSGGARKFGGDLTELALEFGYYDLAHLSREFKLLTGNTLAHYRSGAFERRDFPKA